MKTMNDYPEAIQIGNMPRSHTVMMQDIDMELKRHAGQFRNPSRVDMLPGQYPKWDITEASGDPEDLLSRGLVLVVGEKNGNPQQFQIFVLAQGKKKDLVLRHMPSKNFMFFPEMEAGTLSELILQQYERTKEILLNLNSTRESPHLAEDGVAVMVQKVAMKFDIPVVATPQNLSAQTAAQWNDRDTPVKDITQHWIPNPDLSGTWILTEQGIDDLRNLFAMGGIARINHYCVFLAYFSDYRDPIPVLHDANNWVTIPMLNWDEIVAVKDMSVNSYVAWVIAGMVESMMACDRIWIGPSYRKPDVPSQTSIGGFDPSWGPVEIFIHIDGLETKHFTRSDTRTGSDHVMFATAVAELSKNGIVAVYGGYKLFMPPHGKDPHLFILGGGLEGDRRIYVIPMKDGGRSSRAVQGFLNAVHVGNEKTVELAMASFARIYFPFGDSQGGLRGQQGPRAQPKYDVVVEVHLADGRLEVIRAFSPEVVNALVHGSTQVAGIKHVLVKGKSQ